MKKKMFRPLFLIWLALAACQSTDYSILYVSPDGDDKNKGTVDSPLATLEGARDKIRQYKEKGMLPPEGLTVYLRGGSYPISQTFALEEQDSGTETGRIYYANYADEKPVLSGGKSIPTEAVSLVKDPEIISRLPEGMEGNVYQVDLKALGIEGYGELYQHGFALSVNPAPMELFIDDQPQRLARWPNEGTVKIGKVIDKGSHPREGDFSNRGGIFEYEYERVARWKEAKDIWLSGIFSYGYADDNLQVEWIDEDKKQIKVMQPHIYTLMSNYEETWGHHLRGYFAYNLLEEIDLPGEYYIDRERGILYFYPEKDPITSELKVSSMAEPLMAVENASHVTLQGLTFDNSRGMGVYLEKGDSVVIDGCTFKNLGLLGVMMGKGAESREGPIHEFRGKAVSRQYGNMAAMSYMDNIWDREAGKNHVVQNATFYNLGTGGVILDGGNRKTLTAGGSKVVNCEFYDFNRWNKSYCPGVALKGVGNIVQHNYIHDAPHMAISLHGNDHLIEYNEIARACMEADDMGAIYMGRNPSERGSIIRYNYFHGFESDESHIAAIYFDDGQGGGKVHGNVFYNVGHPRFGAIFVHGGHDNTFSNNVFIDCKRVFGNSPWDDERWDNMVAGELWQKRLVDEIDILKSPYSTKYPELTRFFEQDERLNTGKKNVVYQCDAFGVPQYKLENNWVTDENPGFVDAASQNFSLQPDAPVFDSIPNFDPIPFQLMGLQESPTP